MQLERGKKWSKGARAFSKKAPSYGDRTRIAEKLGWPLSMVSRLMNGRRKATPVQRAHIQRHFPDIDWRWWDVDL
jgi:hypothetical protein